MNEDKMFKSGTKLAFIVPTNCVMLVPVEYAGIVDNYILASYDGYSGKYGYVNGKAVDFRIVSAKDVPGLDDPYKI